MKRIPMFLALAAALVVLCGLTSWRVIEAVSRRAHAEQATATVATTPVEVIAANPRDLVDEIAVAGRLRALHEADVVAEVSGRVDEILADVGTVVTKGQPLARLDDAELGLQVRQAQAGLSAAKAARDGAARDLAGALSVAEVGGVSEAQLVASKSRAAAADAQVEQADATLGLARARLADAVIRAPFAGVVVRRATDIGGQVSPGMPVFGVADLSRLELVLDVDERVAAALRAGDPVGVTSDTVEDLPEGTVQTVSPMLDAVSHKARVVVSLAYVPGLFGHGGATARFRLGRAEGAIAVPSGAILDDKGDRVVYLLEGAVARRTVVKAGVRDGDWIQVTGVTAGASVIVTGNAYLSDGAAVTVRPRQAAEPS